MNATMNKGLRFAPKCIMDRLLKVPKAKREEIKAVVHDPDAGHYERTWVVGTLAFWGYSCEEVTDILVKHWKEGNCETWRNFSPKETERQVKCWFRKFGQKVAEKRKRYLGY